MTKEDFEQACAALPEGVSWGDPLTPEIARGIMAAGAIKDSLRKAAQAIAQLEKERKVTPEQMNAPLDAALHVRPASPDFPDDDAVARSKRILAMVDAYHERPDRMNRNALRGALMDEFTAVLAAANKANGDA